MLALDDTIAAIASAPGGAARGIVRLSGPTVRHCIEQCFQADNRAELASITVPTAVAGTLRMPGFASPLPCELYYWPGTRSYTGQPVAEIHTFGSPPLLEAAVRTLCAAGARLAERGEFTLRAFLAGRIDLTQAEAVLGVIDAANPHELDVALRQLAGGLAGPLHRLRDALLDLLAHVEAGFDFAEEDLPFITREQLEGQLADAAERVADLARQMASRAESTELTRVVLVGRPNTGKSSLFNALVGSAGALVSPQPGTTRDYLSAELCLDGVRCQLVDTAGVKDHCSGAVVDIDQAAAAVAAEQSRQAHVRILCLDATRPLDAWEEDQVARSADNAWVLVWTKVDVADLVPLVACPPVLGTASQGVRDTQRPTATSSVTGEGIDALRSAVHDAVLGAGASHADVVAGTAVRCRESLGKAGAGLSRARGLARGGQGEELIALEVRLALDELGKVVGAVYTDDVLDRIFSRFCIGK